MGCPVNNISQFETGIKNNPNQKVAIIIFANASSNSKAAELVLQNFHLMDRVSDDIDFYLPGYGIGAEKSNRYLIDDEHYSLESMQKILEDQAKNKYSDFHVDGYSSVFESNKRYTQIINSPRLGRILFNMAEYTDFVMEFTRRKTGYHYLGACEMILISTDMSKKLDYENSHVFNLDKIVDSLHGPSLDAFLHSTFEIIRCEGNRQPDLFSRLFRRNTTASIINEIKRLYMDCTRNDDELRDQVIVRKIIEDLNNCLHWDVELEPFYFISYSSKNVMKAMYFKRLLELKNIRVWIAPDGIPQGKEYPVIIPTTLKLAKNFVLLLTPDSAKSLWVQRELAIAIGNSSSHTKVKVLLADGFSIEDIRNDIQLNFLLDQVQVKFSFDDVIKSEEVFNDFIR